MAKNLFDDFPDRVKMLTKYCGLEALIQPMEETFGDSSFFKNPQEAMEFYVGTMSELGRYAGTDLLPNAANIDAEGAKYKDGDVILPERLLENLKKARDLGIFGAPLSRKFDGLNMPRVTMTMALDILGHGCPNTALTIAAFSMGSFVEAYGTEEQKKDLIPKIIGNQIQTAMALTEPNAGSDLGKLRTTAVKKGDHYLINGTKIFITNGNADIVFTLARTDPTSEGLKGLSVLVTPRKLPGQTQLNVKVAKIEDKVCLHASPTCELLYENSVGYLFGPEGEGFKVMSFLMNEARLAMAAIANGICGGAIDLAKKYARTRVTMGKPIIQHPMVADLLYEAELELFGLRTLVAEASIAYDWMHIYQAKGDEKNFKRWKKRYRRLTPLCKYQSAEKVITITRNALQILGGYGVCKDYPAERLVREALIYPIYEGTSQIQSLMVLKDTLKDVALNATGFLGSLAGAWTQAKVTTDPLKSQVLIARNELNQAIRNILMSIIKDKFKSDIGALKESKIQGFLREFSFKLLSEKTDLTYPFLWAERLTRIVSDYYALKSMVDHHDPDDKEQRDRILEYATYVIPRMKLENHYMTERLPNTLKYLEKEKELQN